VKSKTIEDITSYKEKSHELFVKSQYKYPTLTSDEFALLKLQSEPEFNSYMGIRSRFGQGL
jgi:hypothetical protein